MNTIFAVQIAATKSFGGIETAVLAYDAMFKEMQVPSLCLYRGPGTSMLSKAGLDIMPLPPAITGILRSIPAIAQPTLQKIVTLAKGRQILFVIHSDRALPVIRRAFPTAWFITPCHSDKAKGKKNADLAITLNASQQALIADQLAGSTCRAVELGNPFKGSGGLAPEGEKLRLVFCARFTPVKNPVAIIHAHAALDNPPELIMIGDGPLLEDSRKAAGDNVAFLGWSADPWQEITRDDILISPSSWEGLPYMILEALDRGVPVLASDIAGHRAALAGDTYGTLFPLDNHAALVDILKTAVAKPQALREKAIVGRKALPKRFAPEVFWYRLSDELSKISRS